jgi:hypothetical protein
MSTNEKVSRVKVRDLCSRHLHTGRQPKRRRPHLGVHRLQLLLVVDLGSKPAIEGGTKLLIIPTRI